MGSRTLCGHGFCILRRNSVHGWLDLEGPSTLAQSVDEHSEKARNERGRVIYARPVACGSAPPKGETD